MGYESADEQIPMSSRTLATVFITAAGLCGCKSRRLDLARPGIGPNWNDPRVTKGLEFPASSRLVGTANEVLGSLRRAE